MLNKMFKMSLLEMFFSFQQPLTSTPSEKLSILVSFGRLDNMQRCESNFY